MKRFYLIFMLSFYWMTIPFIQAEEAIDYSMPAYTVIEGDTVRKAHSLNEVSVISFKEQLPIEKLPASVSLLQSDALEEYDIASPTDLTAIVPNLYMPKYGSKYSSAIFIRGIGTRMNEPAVGVYVDNAPYLDKTAFDFDYYDMASIEVLRGPQGTLYGRNSMGGIISINTLSPLSYQGSKLFVSYGNENTLRTSFNHYRKLSDNLGVSIGLNYNQTDGFFTNICTDEDADKVKSGGGRFRLDWRMNEHWRMNYTFSYEYSDQNGFPYGFYDKETGETFDVNHNDPSSYRRSLMTNALSLNYKGRNFDMNATTSYQYFDDKMLLDQDFQPKNIFTLQQDQNFHALTEEVVFKSNHSKNYQWLFGVFGFYQNLKTEVPVNFKDEGIAEVINPNFSSIPGMPFPMEITSTNILTDGVYKTPRYSGALFHQSTFHNLLTDGLSLTLGLRLDYEKVKLNYFSHTSAIDYAIQLPPNMPMPGNGTIAPDTIQGKEHLNFTELLPKATLKYELNDNQLIYASVAKGYKAGGYNLQVFADIMQERIKGRPGTEKSPSEDAVKGLIEYKPEYSWNYELGSRNLFFDKKLSIDASLFYIDCKDMQFVQSAGVMGRSMKNAGQVASYGAELAIAGNIDNFRIGLNYGFTHATFRQYTDSIKEGNDYVPVDYKGNYSPLAPKHTLSIAADYTWNFSNKLLDKLIVGAQYAGAGKIYWTEANDVSQEFYGLLNAKVSVVKGICRLDVWTKNTLDKSYHTFYCESMGNSFVQYGKPFQMGVNLTVKF